MPVQIAKKIRDGVMDLPQERISKRTGELFVDEPVSQGLKGIVEVCTDQEGFQQRTAEEIVVPEHQVQEQILQVGKVIPQERSIERLVEQSVDNRVHRCGRIRC